LRSYSGLAFTVGFAILACSDPPPSDPEVLRTPTGGRSNEAAGGASTGGRASGTGGAETAPAGGSETGGKTGKSTASGGNPGSTGGVAGSGGRPASGKGGATASGGKSATASGGKSATGGSAATGGTGGVYDADRDPDEPGILLHVTNGCPFDLWIRAAGQGAVLEPENAQLEPGASQDYVAPDQWPAARVTAYGAGPNAEGKLQQELDKVEMTLGDKVINYNITYVDWLGLPVEMLALGSGDDCEVVGCYLPVGDVAELCPDDLLSGTRCLSAGNYCSQSSHQSSDFCHALDDRIAECASDPDKYPGCEEAEGATTPQVYGCSGFFSGSPKWCAALNRGMLDAPDDGDIGKYYDDSPYNTYAEWVHDVCPGIYAFPYDDYGKTNESGFHACRGGTQLNITFCPAG